MSDPHRLALPNRPLRIAVVSETFPPEINGVARTLGRMVQMLAERGHSLDVIRPRQASEGPGKPCSIHGIREFLVKGRPIPNYPELQVGLAWPATIENTWRAAPPDVVQIVTEGPLGWSALFAARTLGIPVASEFHTNFHAYSRHYGLGLVRRCVATGLRTFHNRCAATMVPTEQIRDELSSQGYQRLAVVGRGIDTQLFNPGRRSAALRARWGCTADEPVVLYVGRLAPEKNLGLFLRAALAVRAGNPKTRIVMVGDGPDAASLRQAHPDIVFSGMQSGEALAAHYASADIFLFPSTTETFGNVTTEAMASGLAIVAYDYAAARSHLRHGESGLLVPFGNESSFIDTASRLHQLGDRLPRMRLLAREAALALSWSRVIDALEAVLHQVAEGRVVKTGTFQQRLAGQWDLPPS